MLKTDTHDDDSPRHDGTVQIREAAWPADNEFLSALHESWTSQYADYIGEVPAKALVRRMLDADELYPNEDQVVQLAMAGTRPVGVATCRSLQGLSLITMLEVLQSHRQQGVGSQLLAVLQARTEQRLMAHVSIHRPQVLRLYESLGFIRLPRTCVDHYGHQLEFDVVVK